MFSQEIQKARLEMSLLQPSSGRSGCPGMSLHGTSGPQAGVQDGQGQSLSLYEVKMIRTIKIY